MVRMARLGAMRRISSVSDKIMAMQEWKKKSLFAWGMRNAEYHKNETKLGTYSSWEIIFYLI